MKGLPRPPGSELYGRLSLFICHPLARRRNSRRLQIIEVDTQTGTPVIIGKCSRLLTETSHNHVWMAQQMVDSNMKAQTVCIQYPAALSAPRRDHLQERALASKLRPKGSQSSEGQQQQKRQTNRALVLYCLQDLTLQNKQS